MNFIWLTFLWSLVTHCYANPLKNSSTRIIQGTNVQPGTYPFMVALRKNGEGHCGGTIISEKWVLTAAHCIKSFKPEDIKIHAATNKRSEEGDVYHSEKFIHHKSFNFKAGNDIGLVKVDRNFDFNNPLIKKVNLSFDYVDAEKFLTVIGFGLTGAYQKDVLQQLNMKSVTNDKCSRRQKISKSELCAFNDMFSGTCSGDSGGPLILKEQNELVGIVSRSLGCAIGYEDIFTRISAYENWIKDNAKDY